MDDMDGNECQSTPENKKPTIGPKNKGFHIPDLPGCTLGSWKVVTTIPSPDLIPAYPEHISLNIFWFLVNFHRIQIIWALKIWPYIVQHLHFKMLKFPLIFGPSLKFMFSCRLALRGPDFGNFGSAQLQSAWLPQKRSAKRLGQGLLSQWLMDYPITPWLMADHNKHAVKHGKLARQSFHFQGNHWKSLNYIDLIYLSVSLGCRDIYG